MGTAIKILIADDQILMGEGLQTILELEEDLEVVGIALNGVQAFEMVSMCKPDLILMDIQMPVMNGLESMKLIKRDFPQIHILFLSSFVKDEYIIEGLANGASGFLLKDIRKSELIDSIYKAVSGHMILNPDISAKLSQKLAKFYALTENETTIHGLKSKHIDFTEREKELALLMIRGLNNRQIAAALSISEGTVKNYISVIYSKVGSNDRSKVILYLMELLEVIA